MVLTLPFYLELSLFSSVPGVIFLVDVLVREHGCRAQDHQLTTARGVFVQGQHGPILCIIGGIRLMLIKIMRIKLLLIKLMLIKLWRIEVILIKLMLIKVILIKLTRIKLMLIKVIFNI